MSQCRCHRLPDGRWRRSSPLSAYPSSCLRPSSPPTPLLLTTPLLSAYAPPPAYAPPLRLHPSSCLVQVPDGHPRDEADGVRAIELLEKSLEGFAPVSGGRRLPDEVTGDDLNNQAYQVLQDIL